MQPQPPADAPNNLPRRAGGAETGTILALCKRGRIVLCLSGRPLVAAACKSNAGVRAGGVAECSFAFGGNPTLRDLSGARQGQLGDRTVISRLSIDHSILTRSSDRCHASDARDT